MALQQFGQGFTAYPQVFGGFRHRQAKWVNAKFPDYFTGMGRIFHRHSDTILMIISQIHVRNIIILIKAKYNDFAISHLYISHGVDKKACLETN